MPENEQDQQGAVEAPETVPGSPEWGGVPTTGGDSADATGGPPTDADAGAGADPTDTETDTETDEDAATATEVGGDAAADAQSTEDSTTGSSE